NLIIVILIVAFFVVALYFFPSMNNESSNEESFVDNEEINSLKQDVEHLESMLFEAEKFIFDFNLAKEYLPYPESEIIYKQVEDTKYGILYSFEDEEQWNRLFIASIDPNVRTN